MSVEEEILERNIKIRAQEMIKNKKLSNDFKKLQADTKLTQKNLDDTSLNDFWKLQFVDQKTNDDLKILKEQYVHANEKSPKITWRKEFEFDMGENPRTNLMRSVSGFAAIVSLQKNLCKSLARSLSKPIFLVALTK